MIVRTFLGPSSMNLWGISAWVRQFLFKNLQLSAKTQKGLKWCLARRAIWKVPALLRMLPSSRIACAPTRTQSTRCMQYPASLSPMSWHLTPSSTSQSQSLELNITKSTLPKARHFCRPTLANCPRELAPVCASSALLTSSRSRQAPSSQLNPSESGLSASRSWTQRLLEFI